MAWSASLPRRPSAARWNISSVSRKQRATTARKSSFFVPKRRKTYGCEMPARSAMSSVEAPSKPCAANSTSAASRISSRRSSFVFRSVTTISGKLVMTHKFVKSLGDPVELALRERRVERQRERPLVRSLGPREEALVAVGVEPVEGEGADLRLDPVCAQGGQHLVAVLDLDHVRLPAVDVAVVGGGQRDGQLGEPLRVGSRDPSARGMQLGESPHLGDPERAEDVGEPIVQPRSGQVRAREVAPAVIAEAPHRV